MGPDELDDLLESIRAEGKKESALALYEGIREEDLVNEDIDERVLKLLGLDEVFDIDYATYISLLKERLAASRNFTKHLSTEEDELLVSEFKKVKGKVGRFKIKRRKITAENITTTGPVKVSREKFFLTSKAVVPTSEEDDEDLKDISKKLDELIKSIVEQGKRERKKAEEERKREEDKKRKAREEALESVTKPIKEILKKVVAPFQSILDRIFRFIKFTFIGFLFDKVLKWFADPANEKKVKLIGRFLKDWWPSLLAAYALFATPFGAFVRGTLKMLRTFIPQLVRFAAAHPLLASAAAIGTATFAGEMWRQGEEKKQIQREATQRNVKPEVVSKELEQAKRSPFAMFGEAMQNVGVTGAAGGGRIKKRSFFGDREIDVRDIGYEGGGGISEDSGVRVTGAGPDTQLVATQPGEIVFSKNAVNYWGADRLLAMNKIGGGTNIPKIANNVQLAYGGGMIGGNPIGGFMNWWNRGRNARVPNENMARFGGLQQYFKKSPNPMTLFGDDKLQITKSNKAFKSGATGYKGWNPFKAFTPNMVKTGPTPAIRQAIERPLRAFSSAPKLTKVAGGAAGSVIMDMIFPEPAFNPTLDDARRRGFPMGPQSRVVPVGTPVIQGKTQMIVLPPTTSAVKKQQTPTFSGTHIPEFSIVANTNHRSMVSSALGIADLV